MSQRTILTVPVICLLLIMLFLTGCLGEKDIAKERAVWANKTENEIVIGIVGPMKMLKSSTSFLDGVNLAVEEVNAQGGAADRKLRIETADDEGSFTIGSEVAQAFAANPKIMAVIGHWHSHVTIPAASIYENAGMLLLSPFVSNNDLCQRGYRYVFQNIPSDEEFGRQMAAFAHKQGYQRIAIYYSDTPYGRVLANSFEQASRESGIQIIDRTCEVRDDYALKRSLDKWTALDYDAVFVAGSMPEAGEFILKLRASNKDVPILGSDGLDVKFIETLGEAAEGAVIATMFNPGDERPAMQQFINKFEQKYDRQPDVWAIQGYESIKLLTQAISKVGNPRPEAVAKALRSQEGWQGVTGVISFNEDGTAKGKEIFNKMVVNGRFKYFK